jgi:small subunit ribosomal protein S6e
LQKTPVPKKPQEKKKTLRMKLNIAYGRHGTVKAFEITEDQVRRSNILGKRLGVEVEGAAFGEQFAGYTFKIRGGADTEGFPMMYGVCAPARVSLLLKRGAVGYNAFRGRNGERRRKAIRGDIIGDDIAVLNLTVSKVGEKALEGVTDVSKPRTLGPKRVAAIRKLWSLPNNADVRKFVVKRKVSKKDKKDRFKGPKIQRLLTNKTRAQRTRKVKAQKTKLEASAQQRREWLSSVTRDRMKQRQRKQASAARVKAVKKH